ncbi:unnamed protein product [Closterium sp. NIES-54]
MALLRVLAFDHEGRPVQFDTWLDDLQLYLLRDSKDSVSLFDLASGAAIAPPATADISTRSQWLSRDAAARLAIRNHLPLAKCTHFGQHKTAPALYDTVVTRYSSPATAALGRLLLPYLFPEQSTFAIVEDLVSHLCASDARYRAAVPAEDHFLSLDPTSLTVDLLEQHLLAAETSAVAVGAARGTLRPPFFEGCSPSPLAPSYASAAAAGVSVPEDVGAASASAKRRSSKGKGVRGGGGGSGGGGGGSGSGGGGSSGGGGGGGTVGGSGSSGGGGGGSGWSGGSGGGGTGGTGTGARRVGFGGGQHQQQQRRGETPSPQQLREWFLRGALGGSFPIAIFDLDFDAILSAMYALSVSAEGDCYQCVPPDPGIAAAALGASESSTLLGTAPAEALHTFTLDSGASHCFFRDSTTLTPPPPPVPVRLADPSGGPLVARSSTVLSCPAVPSGSLSGLHLPSFSTNLVSTAALQDAMVTTTTPGGQRVSICTCTRTGHDLARFTRRPGSSLYTLATELSQVVASAQVSAPGQVAASCLCRLLSHQTLLWHHRLGHPSLPRPRGMHSHLLVSDLPRSLPPLPPSPTLPCLPCVEGRQRAAPHSSSFPLTTDPLQTLHMDVWGLARVSGQSRKRYFLLSVSSSASGSARTFLSCVYTLTEVVSSPRTSCGTVFVGRAFSNRSRFRTPLSKNGIAERRIGLVMEVAHTSMIHAAAPHFLWPFAVRYAAHQLKLWPCVSLPETSPTLRWTGEVGDASVFRVWGSRAFVRDTLADKLFPCAIPYVFLGFVPDAPGWQFYHPTSRRVFPSQDVMFDESVPFYRLFPYRSAPPPPPPLFLAPGPPPVDPFPPQGPAPSGVSQVDPLPSPAPVQVAVESGAARGAASGGSASGGAEPRGAESEGAETGGAELGVLRLGVLSLGVLSLRVLSLGVLRRRVRSLEVRSLRVLLRLEVLLVIRRACLRSNCVSGLFGVRAFGSRGAGPAGAGGPRAAAGAGVTGGTTTTGPGGARTRGTGAAGTGPGVGGVGAGGAGVVDPGGAVRPRPYFVPLLQQVLGTPPSAALTPPLLCPPPDQSQPPLQPSSPLPAPSPYTEQSGGLTKRREPASRLVSPVRTTRRVPRSRPPPVPGTHAMTLRPSSVPLCVPLPAPPESSLPEVLDPESDRARAASPTVSRLLATAVTGLSFESAVASALVAELLDFAPACRLDYATALVAESVPATPPSVGDPDAPDIPTSRSYAEAITGPYSSQWQAAMDAEMASSKSTGTYVAEVPPPGANIVDGMWIFRVKRPPGSPPAFKARYVARGFSLRPGVDYFQTFSPTPKMTTLRVLLHVAALRDYELHSLDLSTTFLQGSPHEEICLRRPVYGLRQAPRESHDTLRTTLAALGFALATADPSLLLRTDTSLSPFYVLVYVDDLVFATGDTEALTLVNSELQKRHTCTDLGELRNYLGLQITRDRARHTITLTQSHMVHQVLQRFGFQFSSPQPTHLSASHSLSAPPSDESVEPSGPYAELVGCLMYLMTCSRSDLAYPLSILARYMAPGRHRKVHWDAAKRALRYLCSTVGMGLVLGGRGPVVLTGHADASWELRWLTFLRTDLGEQPRSPPVLYVDNKAMIAMCQEHRLEHRTKHIALRYFLARELQQRGQLRLAYVATRANTADVFNKALPPGDHQRFVTVLGLVPTLPHLLTA